MESSTDQSTQQPQQGEHVKNKHRPNLIGGLVLVVLGVLFLLDNLLPGFRFHNYWPLILVAVGVGMLWNSYHKQ
jgi:putative Mn2+ efflux pump MntP